MNLRGITLYVVERMGISRIRPVFNESKVYNNM